MIDNNTFKHINLLYVSDITGPSSGSALIAVYKNYIIIIIIIIIIWYLAHVEELF